jgi:hypothetical protein
MTETQVEAITSVERRRRRSRAEKERTNHPPQKIRDVDSARNALSSQMPPDSVILRSSCRQDVPKS